MENKFLHAYKHGIVISCTNSVKQHIYSQIFMYSADYADK